MAVEGSEEDERRSSSPPAPLFAAKDHDVHFEPEAYLNGFYTAATNDGAMTLVLFFLPGILYRLPDKIDNILDLGAGPTVYIPIAFRHRADAIYTSDYALANRTTLTEWIQAKKDSFDWTNVCKWIQSIEASRESSEAMQQLARSKMRAVLEVNVHKPDVVQGVHFSTSAEPVPKQFHVVSTVFCLEYASETLDQYEMAVASAVSLIRPGGYLLQGGVLHATEYSFGNRRFRCFTLTQEVLLATLEKNGMCVDSKSSGFKIIHNDDIFILVSQKK
ncbi:hypothetical protein QR680_014863 [Steinernema hermaphroditum]|uniref:NNMT/PNMT/TEMT family protein n=1 Tax=Steinernema hermaphroditum TaxID=289476 RepID=A0AA39M3Y2_9BILA|nr:hypothetical protein QR680_014863 [Steinernema hermaphroditum]